MKFGEGEGFPYPLRISLFFVPFWSPWGFFPSLLFLIVGGLRDSQIRDRIINKAVIVAREVNKRTLEVFARDTQGART